MNIARQSRGDYWKIFIEPEKNNCFGIIPQAIIRETAFSFILFVSSSKTQIKHQLRGVHFEN